MQHLMRGGRHDDAHVLAARRHLDDPAIEGSQAGLPAAEGLCVSSETRGVIALDVRSGVSVRPLKIGDAVNLEGSLQVVDCYFAAENAPF